MTTAAINLLLIPDDPVCTDQVLWNAVLACRVFGRPLHRHTCRT